PRFANLPDGYFTTAPGTRDLFYYLPGAEPAVIAIDELTKQTLTFSEFDGDDLSAAITVPIFASVGQFDWFNGCVSSCGPAGPPSPPAGLGVAGADCPNAPSFELFLRPRSGRDPTLHGAAPA